MVEKEKKNILEILFFLFDRGSEFLYSWKRVKLQLDLTWYDNTMEKPRCDVNMSCGMFSAAYYRVPRVT